LDSSAHKSGFVKVNGVRLHNLDWGGDGPVLLFLAGLGNSAHIYDKFAPRFINKFHVIGLTRRGHGDSDYPEIGYDVETLTEDVRQFMDSLEIDRAILAGHSMAHIELSHFAALYPERVLKLIYLDAAYDRTSSAFKTMLQKNPLRNIQIPGMYDDYTSIDEYIASIKKYYPTYADIWSEVIVEEILRAIKTSPEGKIVDKMTEGISKALRDALNSYAPEDSKVRAPILSIYALNGGDYYAPLDSMTKEQRDSVIEFFDSTRPALQREMIAQFRHNVPHARVVEIPHGHHYCFIKQDGFVFDEMMKFLLP